MPTRVRIATFNLENFDDKPNSNPTLAQRIVLMRPQLLRADADILCLQEVNSQDGQSTLHALDALLAGTQYADFNGVSTRTQDGTRFLAERNLVILSRFPITSSRQIRNDLALPPAYKRVTAIPPDENAHEIAWERPIFFAQISLPTNRVLNLINVHLKSKIPTEIPGQVRHPHPQQDVWQTASAMAEGTFISSMKRVGQAMETRMLVDQLFDTDAGALIAICGDFNSDESEVPILAIRGDVEDTDNPALAARVLLPCERTVPEQSRYSLIHHGKGNMLDHVIVSRSMLEFYRHTEIHNELLHDESSAFATDDKFPESDHAPVIAEFVLPD